MPEPIGQPPRLDDPIDYKPFEVASAEEIAILTQPTELVEPTPAVNVPNTGKMVEVVYAINTANEKVMYAADSEIQAREWVNASLDFRWTIDYRVR